MIPTLVQFIDGHVNSGPVTIGANTPSPYNGTVINGAKDGTGPADATRNMAEIYNRFHFDYLLRIERAGLTFDPENWAQGAQAISILGASSIVGNFSGVGKPTLAPTAANPFHILVNSNGEMFAWSGTTWILVGGGYKSKYQQSSLVTLQSGINTYLGTLTCPRAGTILMSTNKFASNNSNGAISASQVGFYFYKNAAQVGRIGLIAVPSVTQFEAGGSMVLDVAANDTVSVVGISISTGGDMIAAASFDNFDINYIR